MSDTVLAATAWPTNGHLIADVARLGYLTDDDHVLDPTYENGIWWQEWRPHRHTKPPTGWLFGTSLWRGDELIGVACAGRPARMLDDGATIEITRCCVKGERRAFDNACSSLYGALCRAAKALGYLVAYTYTLAHEDAASVKAAGFVLDAELAARPSKRDGRYVENLFGEPTRPDEAKRRWKRELG